MIRLYLNDRLIETDRPPGTVVLDFVRYQQRLTGTKIGCREGDCGACTVLVGEVQDGKLRYQSMTSCLMPLANAEGKHIVTVEGINGAGLTPAQQCMVDEGGTQCGFCTPGFIMSMTGFCLSEKEPTSEQALAAVDGNICRCTGYKSIERAAAHLSDRLQFRPQSDYLPWLVEQGMVPAYFQTMQERLEALSSQPVSNGHAPSGAVSVGGGTDLFVQKPEMMAQSAVQPLFGRPNLLGIWEAEGRIHLGGGTTVEHIRQSELMRAAFPRLMEFTKLVSSTPIRNMATVAGNLVNASPIGDLTIFFLALDATLVLEVGGQERELPLRDFYKAYKTLDRAPGEIVKALHFQKPDVTTFFNFEKVSKRTHLDIASVNSAACLRVADGFIREAGISAGGVGPIPKYLKNTSEFLTGKAVSEVVLEEALELAQEEVSPISDARGTEVFKRLLLRQLITAHFLTLFPKQIREDVLA